MWSSRRPTTSANTTSESFSNKNRAGKASFSKKRSSFRAGSSRRYEQAAAEHLAAQQSPTQNPGVSPSLTSAIVTLAVGPDQRLFAAHEDVLATSPYLGSLCQEQFYETNKRIDLQDEQPEILSCILEYLYKGDYTPKLEFDKRRHSWSLESSAGAEVEVQTSTGQIVKVLKDTIIYCSALKYGLTELQNLALKKQGLQSGISCATILSSARYAYEHTPDSDSRLRAHYLALIVRSRSTFKRSGTMQSEMEKGGRMFFDLFVAMVNHMDDLSSKR